MADNSPSIWISIIPAASAIIAVAVTQVITAINNRNSDNRKELAENRRSSIKRRIEIGENFYHMFRESQLNHYRQRNILRLERTIETAETNKYLSAQLNDINERSLKLMADTVLWNLTDIYFDIQSTGEITAKAVLKMTDLYTKRIELSSKFNNVSVDEQTSISLEFTSVSDEIINLLSEVLTRVENDLFVVKSELIRLASLLEDTDNKTSFFNRFLRLN